MASNVILNLSDDGDALHEPQEPIQTGPALRRTRSRAIQENSAEDNQPNKRRKVVAKALEHEKEDEDDSIDEDDRDEGEEDEGEVEGETPEQKQARVERKRADTLGLKLEVPIWIEFLKEPHKMDKKGNLLPVKGAGKGDYNAPYTALQLRVYQRGNRIKWIKEDIARHMGRDLEDINWSLVKYCDHSASRNSYQLAGATQKEWANTFKEWTKKPKKPKPIALLMKRLAPPVQEQPDAPPETEDNVPVAGKANPLAKNPTASLIEPPPIPLFNSVKAARGGTSVTNQIETTVIASTSTTSDEQQTTNQAIQLATLALMKQLVPQPADVAPNPPVPIADPPRQQAQYGSIANRYSSVPSLEDFCRTYGLEDSEAKLKALGFCPGDTPQDLAVVSPEDLKDAGIQSLEWRRVKGAVDEYWAQLLANGDNAGN